MVRKRCEKARRRGMKTELKNGDEKCSDRKMKKMSGRGYENRVVRKRCEKARRRGR